MKAMTLFTVGGLFCLLLTFFYVRLDYFDQDGQQTESEALTDEFTRLDLEDIEDPEEEKDPPSTPTEVEITNNIISFHAVQEDDIAGYRVYKADTDGNYEYIESISNHERKNYTVPEASDYLYYVKTVDVHGQESEPSKAIE